MKIIKLVKKPHNIKVGDVCDFKEANINEDCLLESDGEIIGFYLNDLSKYSEKLTSLLALANKEFRGNNVPKTILDRMETVKHSQTGMKRSEARKVGVSQYSTILGSVPPKPVMRRPYPTTSSVHKNAKAKTFIKAMLACALESEKLIKQIAPNIYEKQQKIFEQVDKKWRFGNLFTSSISNFNIAAPFHRDTGNIEGAANVILTKRNNSKGGCLNVPDYEATFEQADNSMLVYPAWRNVHGVTPIIPTHKDGYRNSLIFYPLKAFKGL